MTTPESALARFADARKQFVDAIDGAPTEALTFVSPGDDYALGGLVTHVNGVLKRYGQVLDPIVADPTAELDAKAIDEEMEATNARSLAGLTANDRGEAMATLASLHAHVVEGLSSVSAEDWDRKTPVRYGGGDSYPTGADDIAEWLTGHYFEHVPHVAELLQAWRSGSPAT